MAEPRVTVEVDGRELSLSNLDKQLYPNGFTKAEVISYVTAAAPVWLPHLAERALTMVRFPNGTDGTSFFEKRRPSHAPEWVAGTPLWVTSGSERWGKPAKPGKVPTREEVTFVVVDGVATLVWLANLACLELHTPMGRAGGPWGSMVPTMVVLDLDPGAPATAVECAVVALRIKAVLDELSLESVVKSSGSKGLQVYVPLNRPDATFDRTRAFAQAAALLLESQDPSLVVSQQRKDIRAGKVLVDWMQNEPSKTTVCAYSLRARPRPYVSTPLSWAEVAALAAGGRAEDVLFEPDQVLARVAEHGDLFAPALALEQDLPKLV